MNRPKVLLAEDHALMARRLRELLESSYDVLKTVTDGASLIAAAADLQPDVIVTDFAMPKLSGLAAARIILGHYPRARIVLVTIREEASVVRAALQCGVLAYVLKSDAGDDLLDAVRAAVAGQQYLSTNARTALDQG